MSGLRRRPVGAGEHPCILDDSCPNAALNNGADQVLPVSQAYEYIFLITGGEEALHTQPGWPAYSKLWPAGDGGARSASETIDTSEVDTINFLPLVCQPQVHVHTVGYGACLMQERVPEVPIAGFNSTANHGYYQVKVRPGHEQADVEAALKALHFRFPDYDDDGIVIIPVKYDYEELWRWSQLLDRFAKTSGNTLGITGAWVAENWESYYGGDAVFPSEGPPEAAPDEKQDYRSTIHIRTLELDRTVAALPELLAQLDIPVETVGVVSQVVRSPVGRSAPEVELGRSVTEEGPELIDGIPVHNRPSTERWEYAEWLAAAVAIAVLGVVLVVARRMRQPTK